MDKLVGWLILIAIASAIFVLFYYLLWVKIELTAKYLVSIMTVIAVVYVGYDLLITVFSYGTWAVFFKKLVGSIIIILPISYMLYWLEKLKIKN
jgi:purine-cytosine permease-like protein